MSQTPKKKKYSRKAVEDYTFEEANKLFRTDANGILYDRATGEVLGSPTCRPNKHGPDKWYLKHDRKPKGTKYVHSLIYLLAYGVWVDLIDHIDGNGLNNRPDNLRPGKGINSWNRTLPPDHPTGCFGVSIRTRKDGSKKYIAWFADQAAERQYKSYPFTEEGRTAAIEQRLAWELQFRGEEFVQRVPGIAFPSLAQV